MTNHLQPPQSRLARTAGAALVAALTLVHAAPAQTFKMLYAFNGGNDGANPQGRLVLFAGNLYGTTATGGGSNLGTIFQLNIKSLDKTVLYSFGGSPGDGALPLAGLIADSFGSLYGTTRGGGANGNGAVFQMNPLATTVMHSFGAPPDGAQPLDSLAMDAQGNFYGVTYEGGKTGGTGTVFKMDPSGNLTILHSFVGEPNALGSEPVAGLLPIGNYLYGTNINGALATSGGTVFRTDIKTGKTSLLYAFSGGADGGNPQGQLITDGQGNLYGTTLGGGSGHAGVIYKLNITTHQQTVLHTFSGGDGDGPASGLLRDSQGNFYGTTLDGGAAGMGVVYKMTPSGALTVLHSFLGPEGAYPYATPVMDSSGNLYGVTNAYGPSGNNGTVYEITMP